ncbi:DUF7344 domain-containing protein [Natrarchaeobius chitinivorans]|uniref:DUF7344 domain-containing protein n=1 Tax=Natrarchaeobius chitinivorans TaxID=1679083 RepID=A0A3N6N9Y8_NATCH|nr:hypothetical protein [Natrarchaeobius chitinivorans]RQG95382.1 hypothetical protein EA473_07905 [Natrarchaeobius chitinivorans]
MTPTHISREEQPAEESNGRDDDSDTEGGTNGKDDGSDAEDVLSEDEIFHLLQNERRRLVLRYLRDTDSSVRMRDVAEQVAAWEHETTVEALTSKQRQRVYIPLYQSHLSKLDEAGVIDYQKNRGIVERKPRADRIDQYLQVDSDSEPADEQSTTAAASDYYIAATAICFVAVLGAALELPGMSILTGTGLAALVLMVFTVLTVSQYVK